MGRMSGGCPTLLLTERPFSDAARAGLSSMATAGDARLSDTGRIITRSPAGDAARGSSARPARPAEATAADGGLDAPRPLARPPAPGAARASAAAGRRGHGSPDARVAPATAASSGCPPPGSSRPQTSESPRSRPASSTLGPASPAPIRTPHTPSCLLASEGYRSALEADNSLALASGQIMYSLHAGVGPARNASEATILLACAATSG